METDSEKARRKMDDAIWRHGRKKAHFTVAIQKLKATGMAGHPDVKKVIDLLTVERMKLDRVELF